VEQFGAGMWFGLLEPLSKGVLAPFSTFISAPFGTCFLSTFFAQI
jgi:hypothetical protein